MKKCSVCYIEKTIENFALKPGGKEGRAAICKPCKVEDNQRRNYGLTTKEALQITCFCHLCGDDLKNTKRVCIDHDHESGEVRGVLCSSCNVGLGQFGDSIAYLEMAIEYLKNPPLRAG